MVMDHRNPAHTSIKAKFPFLSSSKYDSSFLNLQQHSDKCRALVVCYRVKGLKKTAYQLESLNLYHLRIRYKCCSSIYIGKAPVCLRLGRANIQTESKSGVSCLRNIQGEPDGTYVRRAAKFRNFPLTLKFPLAKLSAIFMPMQNDFCFSSNQKSAGIDKLVGKSLCQ